MINGKIELMVPDGVLANWQEILDILAKVAEIPVALIMRLRDADIKVLVSSRSGGNPYHPGEHAPIQGSGLYCETVIKTRSKLLVPDALADERWRENPDVRLNLVSYLGFPIMLPGERPFGTICVLDNKRNEYSATIESLMLNFKRLIEAHLEMIYVNAVLGDKNKRLTDYLMELQALRGIVTICTCCKSIRDKDNIWRPLEHYLIRHPHADFSHGICPECVRKMNMEME